MFSQNRDELRQQYFDAWQKFQNKKPLSALEQQIAAIIQEHTEYLDTIEYPDKFIDKDYLPEMGQTNPFLHMGLHLALREQISTNRPAGIHEVYQELCKKMAAHDAEHTLIEVLAETLFLAQKNNQIPDEKTYLEKLNNLATL